MKILSRILGLSVICQLLTQSVNANWIKAENFNSQIPQEINSGAQVQKKDSLPNGVTQDWLNKLTDENGNRINSKTTNSREGNTIEDPQGDSFQRKIFNGAAAGNQFGTSIASAGDVNGDGYADVLIGAPYYSTNTGRAYIYYGGLNMNTVADVIMTGEASSNFFGRSVSSAGDVNGDGYSDVIIGAYGYSSSSGRAYIYLGGASMNNTADVIMSGSAFSDFGNSVSSAGDVNGDGYYDVIVGSFGTASFTGSAYIFFGGAIMNNAADLTLSGEFVNDYYGTSVSSAGDVNSDGYSDVLVGAVNYSSGTGKTYLYFGGSAMNNVSDLTVTGQTAGDYLSQSLSAAGDVNGDGYSDVIIGANGYSTSTGRAYILFGGASMNNIADVTLTGETVNNNFGFSVSSAGDVNGDGYSDVIVGAFGYSAFTGRAYIYFGGSSMNNISDVTMTGESGGDLLGISVSAAGDLNSDGYSDLIAGAIGVNSSTGRVYSYDYYMKNEITQDLIITGETSDNYFGFSVSSAGDVNDDGYDDIIIGANRYSSYTGRAYIFFGGNSMDNVADVTMTGEAVNTFFGFSVSSAGDVNGDGYDDIICGSQGYSGNTGRAYIFFGGTSMDNIADVIMTGETTNNYFGYSAAAAGDVNGDGYSDVIVGAYGYSSNTGRAYIFLGGVAMDNLKDLILKGETGSTSFGFSVSSAGDVNNDAYSDVIVGASEYGNFTGRAYLYYGESVMDSVADVTMTGEANLNEFARTVSSAGDVNGDGYSDIIIGAFGYSLNTGRVYIFFGGIFMDNAADVILNSPVTKIDFGASVSSAGDVNGDGYSDVIVSAPANSSNTGRAFLYFGSASMDNLADVTMKGEAINNKFGISVACAGDLNGDGYSDVIAGAYWFFSNKGRAYVFLGSQININPNLLYVKDVPNDQGGKVNLKWARSGYDVVSNTNITDYLVQRSLPPSGGNFSWENIATIPATYELFYSYTATTLYDSSSNNSGNFFFRITARTSIQNQFWRSNILSGRSIDNIAPLMVSPFTAASAGANVNLNWGASSSPDLLNYILFRSANPVIDPYTATPLSTVSATTYLDISPLSGLYYYFIVAQDIHGNYSPVAVAESPRINLNLTMQIQGFSNTGGTNLMVQDTVKVYLRNSAAPYSIVDSAKTFLSNTGAGTFSFANASNGENYFIQLKHRNSLETWSKTAVSFSNNILAYDFSNSLTKAFGDNMIQVQSAPLKFAIYSGDVNQDGNVDVLDVGLMDNDVYNYVTGYVNTDVTGNNVVDASDLGLVENNAFNFVSKITPP